MNRDRDLIDYFEARSQHRREMALLVVKGIAVTVLVAVLAILAVRTFLHVTEIGARTTVSISQTGAATTTKQPIPIIP